MSAGRELDALVAEKVFGLEVKEGYVWTVSRSSCPDGLPGCCVMHTDRIPIKPKPYSTDIAAAWDVVRKMQADGAEVIIIADKPYFSVELNGRVNGTPCRVPAQVSETAPLAICRAALKAVGHEPDNG